MHMPSHPQVIAAIMRDPSDTTEVSLLYANQTENDILCRDMLESLAKQHPKRLKIWYTLDRPPAKWGYSTGFITDTMIAEHLPVRPAADLQPTSTSCRPAAMPLPSTREQRHTETWPARPTRARI